MSFFDFNRPLPGVGTPINPAVQNYIDNNPVGGGEFKLQTPEYKFSWDNPNYPKTPNPFQGPTLKQHFVPDPTSSVSPTMQQTIHDFNNTKKDINNMSSYESGDEDKTLKDVDITEEDKEEDKQQFDWGKLMTHSGGYSLDSALSGLGYSMSKNGQSRGQNLALGIGSAGKLLLGGARSFLSGYGDGKVNGRKMEEYRKQQRRNMLENQKGVATHNEVRQNMPIVANGGMIGYFDEGGRQSNLGKLMSYYRTLEPYGQDQVLKNQQLQAKVSEAEAVRNFMDNPLTQEEFKKMVSDYYDKQNQVKSTTLSGNSSHSHDHEHDHGDDKASQDNSGVVADSGSTSEQNNSGVATTSSSTPVVKDDKKVESGGKKDEQKPTTPNTSTKGFSKQYSVYYGKTLGDLLNANPGKVYRLGGDTYAFLNPVTKQYYKTNLTDLGKYSANSDYSDEARQYFKDAGAAVREDMQERSKWTNQAGVTSLDRSKMTPLFDGDLVNFEDMDDAHKQTRKSKIMKKALTNFHVDEIDGRKVLYSKSSGRRYFGLNNFLTALKAYSREYLKDNDAAVKELYDHIVANKGNTEKSWFTPLNKKDWTDVGKFAEGGEIDVYAEGGEVPADDVVAQLQQAVETGEISPEEAEAYLQQIQGQSQPQTGGQEEQVVAQLQQAVANGEMSEEEAIAYLQQMQGGQLQQAPQPQMSPEEAQAQLAEMVRRGEIGEEEAMTYLQQMYGAEVSSDPQEPYTSGLRENMTPEQYLTGEYTSGDENRPHNAEVEAGEYVNRNGTTQKVLGDKHSRGGEKMMLEEGTIVISDQNRIGAENAKALSLQTGMKLKAGDTYAQVIDIFTKKIGIEDLNKQQEDLFKKLKQVRGKGSERTQELNNEFLNGKIAEIEMQKKGLLKYREQLVKILFEMQESAKQTQSKYKMAKGGMIQKFPNGGSPAPGPVTDPNVKSQEDLEKLNIAFGGSNKNGHNIQPNTEYGNLLKNNFAMINSLGWGDKFNMYYDKDGNILKNAITLHQSDQFDNFGDLAKHLKTANEMAVTNLGRKDYGDDKIWWSQLTPEQQAKYDHRKYFVDGSAGHRAFRYLHGDLDEVDFDDIHKNGGNSKYKTFVGKNGIKYYVDLDENGRVKKNALGGWDVRILRNKAKPAETVKTPEEVKKEEQKPYEKPAVKPRSNFFLMPDQSVLPPESLRSVPKQELRLNYMDRVQVSPEEALKENHRQYEVLKDKLSSMPDHLRAANLAQLGANIGDANSKLMSDVIGKNLQSDLAIRTSNLNNLHKQAEYDLKLADTYDNRMNKAIDTTRKDLEGYYDFNRKVNIGEFNTRHQLSLLNQLYDNYGINSDGTIKFDVLFKNPYVRDHFSKLMAEEAANREKQKTVQTKTGSDGKTSTTVTEKQSDK